MNSKLVLPALFLTLTAIVHAQDATAPLALYNFDEGTGTTASNTQDPKQTGKLTDVDWVKPGYQDSAAALGFNGKTSRLDLPAKSTPNGPMAIEIAVRPKAYDGLFLADVGGLTLGTKADGKPFIMRINADGKWAYAAATTPLPLNQWSLIGARWDGAKIQILVNGTVAGEAPCTAKFSSSRAALGYNPYGAGSQYFNGDLDAFTIRPLQP